MSAPKKVPLLGYRFAELALTLIGKEVQIHKQSVIGKYHMCRTILVLISTLSCARKNISISLASLLVSNSS